MQLIQDYQTFVQNLTSPYSLTPSEVELVGILIIASFIIASLIAAYLAWLSSQWILTPAINILARRLFRPNLLKKNALLEITFPDRSDRSLDATAHLLEHIHVARTKNPFKLAGLVKERYSFEIASSLTGTHFYMDIPDSKVDSISASLLSYEPGLSIKRVEDYFTTDNAQVAIAEMKLSRDFALSLKTHSRLADYDPLSYLTSQLAGSDGYLSAYQLIVTPIRTTTHSRARARIARLRRRIARSAPLSPDMTGLGDVPRLLLKALKILAVLTVKLFIFALSLIMHFLPGPDSPGYSGKSKKPAPDALSPSEQELHETVRRKLDQPLFETTIRLLATGSQKHLARQRLAALTSTLAPFTNYPQKLTARISLPGSTHRRAIRFAHRRHSPELLRLNPVLSATEISSLYHFPSSGLHPKGLSKSKSKQLPSPVPKSPGERLDVVLGKSRYGGSSSPIGLTLVDRRRHTYIIGKTGMGKTTLMTGAIYQDMLQGNGLAVLDPHGDMFKHLLGLIPDHRQDDVIVFDPADSDYPIALNILDPGLDFDSKEEKDQWITSAVISVFQKLSDEKYWGPKMEHILRNATLTALQLPDPTLYTIHQLLTNRSYRKSVVSTLSDPLLAQFWLQEFSLMGPMQLSSAISPITHRLGQFLTSPRARRILMQPHSTISVQDIMNDQKILLVNLAKGELGEDQSRFFGTLITALIWMGAYARTKLDQDRRPDFLLYIDEFQNFATARFADIASEGRKFGIAMTTAHQNVAQIQDTAVLKTITANSSTLICLAASPDDEQFMIPFMHPDISAGDITNLLPYQFFMKTTGNNTGTYSGSTLELALTPDARIRDIVLAKSRSLYALTKLEATSGISRVLSPAAAPVPTTPSKPPRRRLQPAFAETLKPSKPITKSKGS